MFGAWGIVIGPVLMIVIVTTISVYLAVYKGVPMDQPDEKDEKPKRRNPFWWLGRRASSAHEAKAEAEDRAGYVRRSSEELDDTLECIVGRMALLLAQLQRQHRVGHVAEPVLVALLGVDLDDLERVAQPVLERLEPFNRAPCGPR